jgi:hypothetical protein
MPREKWNGQCPCGKKFDDTVDYEGYKIAGNPRKYCSTRCRDRVHVAHYDVKDVVMVSCPIDGTKFNARTKFNGEPLRSRRKFCSPECQEVNRKRKQNERQLRRVGYL